SRLAGGIDGHADDATWQLPLELLAGGHERRVRTAIAEWYTKALAAAADDVGAQFARRAQDRQRQQVGGDDYEATSRVHAFDGRGWIVDATIAAGVLQQHAEVLAGELGAAMVTDFDLDAERFGASPQHGKRLRVHVLVDEERIDGLASVHAVAHRHAFGRCGRFIEQRTVR